MREHRHHIQEYHWNCSFQPQHGHLLQKLYLGTPLGNENQNCFSLISEKNCHNPKFYVNFMMPFDLFWKRLLGGTIPVHDSVLTGRVPVNNSMQNREHIC